MRHQIDDSVSNEIDEILTDPQSINPAGLASVVTGLARHPGGFYYLLQDSAGSMIIRNMPGLDPKQGIREWAKTPGVARPRDRAVRGKGVAVDGGYLFVGWSTHQLREMQEMVTRSFMWGLAASVALALVGGVLAGRRIMRKIESVSETTRDIVAGDLTRRVRGTAAGDEFDHLAASINGMLDRIQSLMSELQQVTTDIAHDACAAESLEAAAGECSSARMRLLRSCARRSRVQSAKSTSFWAISARCCASPRSKAALAGRDFPPST